MTMLPWSSVYALFFLVASFLFVSLFLKSGHAHDAILAGACAACTFWCRQPVGVFLVFSYILYFLVLWILKQRNRSESMKMMLGLGAGFFGVSAVIIVWIVANGALNDWWLQSFVHATAWQKNHDGSLRYIFESLLAVSLEETWYRMHVGFMIPVWTIMPLVCLVVCIVFTIVPVVRKRIAFPPSILVLGGLSYVSMASWLQYYPVTCFRHIYWSAAPMTGIVAYMAMRLIRGSRLQAACNDMRFALAVIVVLTAFYARDVQVRLRIGINHLAQPMVVIQAPGFLKGMRELPVVATAAGDLDRQVNLLRSQSPGIGIAVKGELANIMCLAYSSHRPGENPGIRTLFLNWGGYDNCNVYPDYEAAISRYIADRKPMVIHRVGETLVLPGYGENRCWQPLRFCMEIPDGMTK
jgi:hypothetical protein